MKVIKVGRKAGPFAEDKDVARDLRLKRLLPALENGQEVALDFEGVHLATQSFVHALISDVIRQQGSGVLDRIVFVRCSDEIKSLIAIVSEYSQDSVE
jgi:hypothetical protein